MDLFLAAIFGGLAYWFRDRLLRLEQKLGRLAQSNADLAERLLAVETGAAIEAREPAPAEAQKPIEPLSQPVPDIQPEAERESGPAITARPIAPASVPASVPKVAKPAVPQMAQVWPEDRGPQASEEDDDDAAPQYRDATGFNLPKFDFEDIFGRLLPIWGGGIALAIAGFFMVRWSIENGLLNEYVRVGLGFAFGLVLVAAAEVAHRFSARLADERVRQALSGAGIATLYASFYLAGTQYGLIGPALAFAGMAGVTLLAILLSFRFGLPSAVLGLVGGFATPVLAGGTEPNLPVLATYLALVTGGLAYTGRKQERSWLGLAALAGGLGWGVIMLIAGPSDDTAILAVGGYLVMVGALLPSLLGHGLFGTIGRIAAAVLATLQIAALIATSGYSLLAWGTYLLVAAALAVLGWRNHRLREAGAVAAGLAVCLLAAWPAPELGWYGAIAAACVALFAAVPLAHIWREDAAAVDWGKLAAFPLLLIGAFCVQWQVDPLAMQNFAIALVAAALALLPATAAWLAWPRAQEALGWRTMTALVSALGLVWLGGMLAVPMWAAPLVNAAAAGLGFALLRQRISPPAAALGWAFAGLGVAVLLATSSLTELGQIIYYQPSQPEWLYALRWIAAAVPFALILLGQPGTVARRTGETALALITYCAAAMLVPADYMPLTLLAGIALLAWRLPQRASGMAVWLGLGATWAIVPVFEWFAASSEALAGQPVFRDDLPTLADLARYVLPLLAALVTGFVLRAKLMTMRWLQPFMLGLAGALGVIIVHTVYKGLFAIADDAQFIQLGLAERTVWQGLLAALGIALLQIPDKFAGQRMVGYGLAGLAAAHFAIFTLLLHNPLVSEQAVGAWPIVNLLLPAYGIVISLLVFLRGRIDRQPAVFDGAIMVLVALLALSQLRHGFAGTLLLDPPVGATEDLLRSLLAIVLALAYLGWGAWRKQRSWRIGSLVLMLGAVGKVFLFDAAGLEGLARIASFMALGLCLIGIGWFYTKQLSGPKRQESEEDAA